MMRPSFFCIFFVPFVPLVFNPFGCFFASLAPFRGYFIVFLCIVAEKEGITKKVQKSAFFSFGRFCVLTHTISQRKPAHSLFSGSAGVPPIDHL